jgi:hypothetical protein
VRVSSRLRSGRRLIDIEPCCCSLRELLKVASGGAVFTTIQKFFPDEKGGKHPLLSDRRNIVSSSPTKRTVANAVSLTASPSTCAGRCPRRRSLASPSHRSACGCRAMLDDGPALFLAENDADRSVLAFQPDLGVQRGEIKLCLANERRLKPANFEIARDQTFKGTVERSRFTANSRPSRSSRNGLPTKANNPAHGPKKIFDPGQESASSRLLCWSPSSKKSIVYSSLTASFAWARGVGVRARSKLVCPRTVF